MISVITRSDIEQALDHGQLWAHMSSGRYWVLRRNGRTQMWKKDPDRFRIPVKAGLRCCAQITQYSQVALATPAHFVISPNDPN